MLSSLQGARAKLGILTNQEDIITGPVNSIGAPKMYIFGKHILGTSILKLGFPQKLEKYLAQLFNVLRFSLWYLKTT